jgi:hypothetical protein
MRKSMDMSKMKHIQKLTDSQLKLAKTDLMYNPNEGLIKLDSENIFKVEKSIHKKTLKETTKKVVNETSALKPCQVLYLPLSLWHNVTMDYQQLRHQFHTKFVTNALLTDLKGK